MTIEQIGDAEKPLRVEHSGGDFALPLPAASTVQVVAPTATTPGSVSISVAADTVLTGKVDTLSTVAPVAFQPDKPPTQNELANADGIRWGYIAGGVFLLVALACVYFQHYKAAGFAAIGAFVVPVSARFLASDKAMIICGVLGAIVVTLVGAWYFIDGKVDGKLSVNKSGFGVG